MKKLFAIVAVIGAFTFGVYTLSRRASSTTRASLPACFLHFQLQMYSFFSFLEAFSLFYLE